MAFNGINEFPTPHMSFILAPTLHMSPVDVHREAVKTGSQI